MLANTYLLLCALLVSTALSCSFASFSSNYTLSIQYQNTVSRTNITDIESLLVDGNSCLPYVFQFVTSYENATVPVTTDGCLHVSGTAAWNSDPCCNNALEMCCTREPRNLIASRVATVSLAACKNAPQVERVIQFLQSKKGFENSRLDTTTSLETDEIQPMMLCFSSRIFNRFCSMDSQCYYGACNTTMNRCAMNTSSYYHHVAACILQEASSLVQQRTQK